MKNIFSEIKKKRSGFSLGCKNIKLFPEAELPLLLQLGLHPLLQGLLVPGQLPLYLGQGLAHPAFKYLSGRDGDTLAAAFGEVTEVQLLQLFDSQSRVRQRKPDQTGVWGFGGKLLRKWVFITIKFSIFRFKKHQKI